MLQNSGTLRLLLADDHVIVLESLFLLLSENPRFLVSGMVASGKQALTFMEENEVDVLVTDLRTVGMSGIELCQKAMQKRPSLKVLILTMIDDPTRIKQAIGAGAAGYILKNADADELELAINTIFCGNRFFSEHITLGLPDFEEPRTVDAERYRVRIAKNYFSEVNVNNY